MSVDVLDAPAAERVYVAPQQFRVHAEQLRRSGLPVPAAHPAAPPTNPAHEATWIDFYCGGGGSTSGIHLVPGNKVVRAVNHWDVAIATHNANFPDTDHDQADVTGLDPAAVPRTDNAWFSPECTHWTVARGEKCDYDAKPKQLAFGDDDEDDEPLPDEAKRRSRAQMRDVVTFARHHRYRVVVVENVTDILKWKNFKRWLGEMHAEGYRHKIQIVNSAFATKLGPGAPQLRDRVYIIFLRSDVKEPNWDKWFRPRSLCPSCGDNVDGMQVIEPGRPRIMRYGVQYWYRCPKAACQGTRVHPYALPALTALDLSRPGERIGDRKRPLKPNTYERVEAGVRKYFGRHLLVPAGGTHRRAASPADRPMPARTTTESDALLVPVEGRNGVFARPASGPMRAQTGRHQDALLVPLRNNGVARPVAEQPLHAFAAAGTHHAIVMRNNTARGNPAQMSTPVGEPLRGITTAGHQSLISFDPPKQAIYAYDTGLLRPVGHPMPAQTGIEGDALVGLAAAIEECFFRMLFVDEIRAGMDFYPGYILLGGSKRKNVKILGNAVTPCASRDIIACVSEAALNVEYELAA